MSETPSATRLSRAVERDRGLIADGSRPRYHATWTTGLDGSTDVRIVELPTIHLFVPDPTRMADGARLLVARTLEVDVRAFDLETVELENVERENVDPSAAP